MLISSILSVQYKVLSRSQYLAVMTIVAIIYICQNNRMIPCNMFLPEERHFWDVSRPGIWIMCIDIHIWNIHIWHIHITDILAMVSRHGIYIYNTKKTVQYITPKLGVQLFQGCIYPHTHTYIDTRERLLTELGCCLPVIWPEFEPGRHGNSVSSRTNIATYVPIFLPNYLLTLANATAQLSIPPQPVFQKHGIRNIYMSLWSNGYNIWHEPECFRMHVEWCFRFRLFLNNTYSSAKNEPCCSRAVSMLNVSFANKILTHLAQSPLYPPTIHTPKKINDIVPTPSFHCCLFELHSHSCRKN